MPNKKTPNFDPKTYMNKYVSEKIIYKRVNFTKGKPEDDEIVVWLDAQPDGIAPYVKRLIWRDMTMKRYTIKPDFLSLWGEDCTKETVITGDEVARLSVEWGKPVEDLLEQLIEIDEG